MLDVLLLLAVTRWLLKSLDDEGRCGWNNGDGGLTVLDGKTDGNAESLPVTSCLGDIFSDLLWGETERTNLWSKCGRSTDLTSGGAEVDDLDLVWVDLWCCEMSDFRIFESFRGAFNHDRSPRHRFPAQKDVFGREYRDRLPFVSYIAKAVLTHIGDWLIIRLQSSVFWSCRTL